MNNHSEMFGNLCGFVMQVIDEHRKGYQYVWFTNPFPLASIPSVRVLPSHCFWLVYNLLQRWLSCINLLMMLTLEIKVYNILTVMYQLQVWHAHCISRPLKGSSKRDKAVNAMLRGSGR